MDVGRSMYTLNTRSPSWRIRVTSCPNVRDLSTDAAAESACGVLIFLFRYAMFRQDCPSGTMNSEVRVRA